MKRTFFVVIFALLLTSTGFCLTQQDEAEIYKDVINLITENDIVIGLTIGEPGGFAGSVQRDFLRQSTVVLNNAKYDLSELEIFTDGLSDSLSERGIFLYSATINMDEDSIAPEPGEKYPLAVYHLDGIIYQNELRTPETPVFDDELHYDEQGKASIFWTLPQEPFWQFLEIAMYPYFSEESPPERDRVIISELLSPGQSSYTFPDDVQNILSEYEEVEILHQCIVTDKQNNAAVMFYIDTEYYYNLVERQD